MRGWKRFHISPDNDPTDNIDRANYIIEQKNEEIEVLKKQVMMEGDVNAKLLNENAELKTKLEAKEIEFANLKEDALNTDKARENWLQLAKKQAKEIMLLRRALCLEKADRAKETKCLWHVYCHSTYLHYCSADGASTRMNPLRRLANKSYKEWVAFWGNIEENYRKLAEKLK